MHEYILEMPLGTYCPVYKGTNRV